MPWGLDNELRLLAATVADYAIVLMDTGGKINRWSSGAQVVFGYSEAEIVGQTSAVLYTPEDRQVGTPERELSTALHDGRAGGPRWYVRKDGHHFWGNGVMVSLYGTDGQHQGFGKVVRDETLAKEIVQELERADQRLRQSDAQKDLFLATLAHELKNPISAIRLGVRVLRVSRTEAEREEWYEMIERQTADLMRLVADLLDVTRITTGKVEIRKERVNVADVMDRAADAVREQVTSRHHTLSISHPPADLCLEADPDRLRQVFVNLLANAAKYTDEGGTISFAAAAEGDQIVFRIRDSGIGISQEMLPRIFDLFCQIDYSFQRSGGGLGIGLSLARNLVQLHGGTLDVRSEGFGKGSEFIVLLPRC